MMDSLRFPRIEIGGSAVERGRSYGEQTRERVALSVDLYREVFAAYAGWDWEQVRAEAQRYLPSIEAYDPRYVREMTGIAEGAGLSFADVVAINVRTEIMFSAKAREAASGRGATPLEGCSSVAVLPEASADGHTLLAQNWDWLDATGETTVVVEAQPDDGPAYLTVVEAGLLAKIGLNEHGVGVMANALACYDDRGQPGVPFHVCLRSLMEARTAAEALERLQRAARSSSANYLVATSDGLAFTAEGQPGDFSRLLVEIPERGRLLHTNHFISPRFSGVDVGRWVMYDSPLRLQRLRTLLGPEAPPPTMEAIKAALMDHAGHPMGICSHADTALDRVHSEGTVASLAIDLTQRRVWLADGNPCEAGYRPLDLGPALR
jgi:isopenicillin-N N-acyltransferase like protein